MIVYGDPITRENLRSKQRLIEHLLAQCGAAPGGIVRHSLLVSALIEAGELAQAQLDAGFWARGGIDDGGTAETSLMGVLMQLAEAVGRSWDDGFQTADTAGLAALVGRLDVPDAEHDVRHPEGFTHYAVYPEAYWTVARRLGPHPEAAVIGLRSIGTTLAAMVARGLATPAVLTLRPVGPPFSRRLSLTPRLEVALAHRPDRPRAVVDEGPGLSGSSFGAVADALELGGVKPHDILFFPGHAGDLGREASPAHRTRWQRARRYSLSFVELTGATAARHQQLAAWIADLTGSATHQLVDLSGGAWRMRLLPDVRRWPPVDTQNEKLKFLAPAAHESVLMRFTGLGRRGLAKFRMAEALAAEKFCVAPVGWRHGFLVEPWLADARPLNLDEEADRAAVLNRLPAYLAFRARQFPAAAGGASPPALHAMAKVNIAESLGDRAAAVLDRWTPERLDRLAAAAVPVLVDGRLQPWEWLARPDGTLVKTDALDHHAGHDLIGAQDIAWDIAGARVEWSLSATDVDAVVEAVGRGGGRPVDRGLLGFFALAYPAFQLGCVALAESRATSDEQRRFAAQARFYRLATLAALASSSM